MQWTGKCVRPLTHTAAQHTLENSFIQQADLTHPICFTRRHAEGLTSHAARIKDPELRHVSRGITEQLHLFPFKAQRVGYVWGTLAGICPPGPRLWEADARRGPRAPTGPSLIGLTVKCRHMDDNEFIYKGAEDAREERARKRDALGLFWQRSSPDRSQAGDRVQRDKRGREVVWWRATRRQDARLSERVQCGLPQVSRSEQADGVSREEKETSTGAWWGICSLIRSCNILIVEESPYCFKTSIILL